MSVLYNSLAFLLPLTGRTAHARLHWCPDATDPSNHIFDTLFPAYHSLLPMEVLNPVDPNHPRFVAVESMGYVARYSVCTVQGDTDTRDEMRSQVEYLLMMSESLFSAEVSQMKHHFKKNIAARTRVVGAKKFFGRPWKRETMEAGDHGSGRPWKRETMESGTRPGSTPESGDGEDKNAEVIAEEEAPMELNPHIWEEPRLLRVLDPDGGAADHPTPENAVLNADSLLICMQSTGWRDRRVGIGMSFGMDAPPEEPFVRPVVELGRRLIKLNPGAEEDSFTEHDLLRFLSSEVLALGTKKELQSALEKGYGPDFQHTTRALPEANDFETFARGIFRKLLFLEEGVHAALGGERARGLLANAPRQHILHAFHRLLAEMMRLKKIAKGVDGIDRVDPFCSRTHNNPDKHSHDAPVDMLYLYELTLTSSRREDFDQETSNGTTNGAPSIKEPPSEQQAKNDPLRFWNLGLGDLRPNWDPTHSLIAQDNRGKSKKTPWPVEGVFFDFLEEKIAEGKARVHEILKENPISEEEGRGPGSHHLRAGNL